MERTLFNPSNHNHRTQAQWASSGQPWYWVAFVHAVQHGEARCLLNSGYVIRFFTAPDGQIDLEVLHATP